MAETADVGTLTILPYPIADTVEEGNSSIPAALIFSPDESDNSRCLFAQCQFIGDLPTSATIELEVSNVNQDSTFISVGTVATVVGGEVTQSGAEFSFIAGKFVRLTVSTASDAFNLVGQLFA